MTSAPETCPQSRYAEGGALPDGALVKPISGWAKGLFCPRRVALYGASETPGKVGHSFLRNLTDPKSGFSGEVLPVHPSLSSVMGLPAVSGLGEARLQADLAIIVTPPAAVPAAIRDCAEARIPVAVIVTSGFAEAGADGAALQRQMLEVAHRGNVRIVGPNCFGVISPAVGLNASMALGMPRQGGIGLFTQSGAYGMAAFTRSQEDGIGFSRIIAAGNKADLDETDVLQAFASDPETRVIAMLLESISDGRRFFEAARQITPSKPVIVMKSGRGVAGKRAAESHTASLSSDFVVARAALRQAGVRVVEDGGTLLDLASAMDKQPELKGNRVAIITNSGGTGVELADLFEARGIDVPSLSPRLQADIATVLPAFGSAQNPVDVTTDWKRFPEMYGQTLAHLHASDEVDAIIPVLLQRSALSEQVVDRVIEETRQAQNAGAAKPVHVCWVAPAEGDKNRQNLLDAGIPCHIWPARTAEVVSLCASSDPEPGVIDPLPPIDRPDGTADDRGWLPSETVFAFLERAGLPVAPWKIVASEKEAAEAAREVGPPVVLKAECPGLVHKSDAGGVLLNISSPEEAAAGFRDLKERLGAPRVLVQKQVESGLELILGASQDPVFGPVVLAGLGGIWVETLGDVAMRLPPFSTATAGRMLDELKARSLLSGSRGQPGVDTDVLSDLISKLSNVVAACPWLEEMDLNPVIANGDCLTIADARLRVRNPLS